MTRETIAMSHSEVDRLQVIQAVIDRYITQAKSQRPAMDAATACDVWTPSP